MKNTITGLDINKIENELCKCEVVLCGYKFEIYMKEEDYKNLIELQRKGLL